MHLFRVVVGWQGPQIVGQAVTVLHFDGSNTTSPGMAGIKSAFQAAAGFVPTGITMTVPSSGDIIEDTTGQLTGVWNSTGGGPVAGAAPANCAAGVGACVTWNTGGVVRGRKLRGRTFLVPISVDGYGPDGTLNNAWLTNLEAFANTLQSAGGLHIWSRPTGPAAADGTSYAVLGHRIRDKVAYLSSRRD